MPKVEKLFAGLFELKLVLITLCCLLIFKFLITLNLALIFSTFFFESAIYVLILLLYLVLAKKLNVTAKIIFYVLFAFHTFATLLSTYFMPDFLYRKYSILSINAGTASFVIKDLFPIKYMIIIVGVLAGIFLIAYFLPNLKLNINAKAKWIAFAVCVILLVLIPNLFSGKFESVYTNTINDLFIFGKQDIPIRDVNYDPNVVNLEKTIQNYNLGELKYKRIFFFVMEEISSGMFEKDLQNISKEKNFFEKVKQQSNYYENYYTNHQDSRGALLVLLSSIFVSYESYSYSDWYDLYARQIIESKNLVEFFNQNNFSTVFLSSIVDAPFEMQKYPWKKFDTLSENDYDSASNDYLCMHVLQYEKACEDRVLLKNLEKLAHSENIFVLDEFIYGHTHKYIEEKKQTRLEYYNDFFYDFYTYLEENNLLDDTLIVITSDHGLKDPSSSLTIEGYKIPLIFIANDLNYFLNNNLLSHMEFKDILFSYILKNHKFENPDCVYITGTTQSNLFAYVCDKDYAVVNYLGTPYLVSSSSTNILNNISYNFSFFLGYKKYFEGNN
ncbi:MAG: hypothetical protein COT14_02540 [Candidatus Diapherotrites archaeon CG08_land_8_20_14_0_20_30_16]|nr:MAG: hypothetical protein COT14_02540 [Candidatus Diapherotrites archaeon CG08_land_8_20_14_0_20_30_16]